MLQIPVTAEVLNAMDFANAISKYTKPKSDGDARPEVDPSFQDYIVPGGMTNRTVVPVLPAMPK